MNDEPVMYSTVYSPPEGYATLTLRQDGTLDMRGPDLHDICKWCDKHGLSFKIVLNDKTVVSIG